MMSATTIAKSNPLSARRALIARKSMRATLRARSMRTTRAILVERVMRNASAMGTAESRSSQPQVTR
jgi:hypothetical protein